MSKCIHFPVAAEMNGHNLDGLKQQKDIILQFWRLKSELKELAGPYFL